MTPSLRLFSRQWISSPVLRLQRPEERKDFHVHRLTSQNDCVRVCVYQARGGKYCLCYHIRFGVSILFRWCLCVCSVHFFVVSLPVVCVTRTPRMLRTKSHEKTNISSCFGSLHSVSPIVESSRVELERHNIAKHRENRATRSVCWQVGLPRDFSSSELC